MRTISDHAVEILLGVVVIWVWAVEFALACPRERPITPTTRTRMWRVVSKARPSITCRPRPVPTPLDTAFTLVSQWALGTEREARAQRGQFLTFEKEALGHAP